MNNISRLFGIVKTNIRSCGNPMLSQSLSPLMISRLSTNESNLKIKRKELFEDALPVIVESLATNPKLKEVEDVASWIKEILNYNLKGGKLARGLTTVMAYEILEKPENITNTSIQLSCIAGWCVEMTYLLMVDDILDGSETRRGIPCWYTLPHVRLGAINDTILVYTSMYHILRSYLGHMPQYLHISDLFNEALLLTSIGQHLDYSMAHRNKHDYSLFTMERYNAIVKYKTSFYTYKLPVCLGMLMANNNDETAHKKAEEICFKIGRMFQMQDDFIDVYGLESVTGKLGTDIQEGKCSWVAVTALQLCNDAQRSVFTSFYGNSDPASVKKIKKLFKELDIPKIYRQEERACYDEVINLVNTLDKTTRAPELFLKLLDDIYNRKK